MEMAQNNQLFAGYVKLKLCIIYGLPCRSTLVFFHAMSYLIQPCVHLIFIACLQHVFLLVYSFDNKDMTTVWHFQNGGRPCLMDQETKYSILWLCCLNNTSSIFHSFCRPVNYMIPLYENRMEIGTL